MAPFPCWSEVNAMQCRMLVTTSWNSSGWIWLRVLKPGVFKFGISLFIYPLVI
jgi:hypothetical protein